MVITAIAHLTFGSKKQHPALGKGWDVGKGAVLARHRMLDISRWNETYRIYSHRTLKKE
jgi:hypothetical protein